MNCAEFKGCLNDSIDQELGSVEQAVFDAHRASCEACQVVYAAELAMLEGLRAMPVVEPPEGFADRVLANAYEAEAELAMLERLRTMPVAEPPEGFADRVLANAYKAAVEQNVPPRQNHHRRGFALGFGSAAAAALAVWVVVGMSPGELSDTGNASESVIASTGEVVEQPTMSITVNTQQTIRLAFASNESLQGAKITIRLPENVALVGYPGRRQLSWETNLKKGDNLLNLPIIATQVAQGELIADIEYEGRVKTLTLNLETGAEALPATSSVDSKFHLLIG